MTSKLKFPLKFDKCPNCSSTKRVAELVTQEEIDKKNLNPEARTPILVTRSVIADTQASNKLFVTQRKVPLLFAAFDVCGDCGTLYCIQMDKAEGTIGTQIPPPFGDLPRGFGRG